MTPEERQLLYETCTYARDGKATINELKEDIKSLYSNGKATSILDTGLTLRISNLEKDVEEMSHAVEALEKTAYLNKRVSQAVYVIAGSAIAALTYVIAYKLF